VSLTLPLRTDLEHYDFSVELDGASYFIEVRYNSRNDSHYLSISDVEGVPLLIGRRVVIDFPLTRRFKNRALPAGEFMAVDTSGQGRDPGAGELGGRVQILYATAAEMGG